MNAERAVAFVRTRTEPRERGSSPCVSELTVPLLDATGDCPPAGHIPFLRQPYRKGGGGEAPGSVRTATGRHIRLLKPRSQSFGFPRQNSAAR